MTDAEELAKLKAMKPTELLEHLGWVRCVGCGGAGQDDSSRYVFAGVDYDEGEEDEWCPTCKGEGWVRP